MFKFKIGEKVIYQDIISKIEIRTFVENESNSIVLYKLDNGISNVKESELKSCPKYTITIEDSLGKKSKYYAEEIVGMQGGSLTISGDKTIMNGTEIDCVYGVKLK